MTDVGGASTSGDLCSVTEGFDNSMEHNNDSNSVPPGMLGESFQSNGERDVFGRDRLSAESTSSLMEPPPAIISAGIGGSGDSMSSPMEVI